jgi:hypothetical protein
MHIYRCLQNIVGSKKNAREMLNCYVCSSIFFYVSLNAEVSSCFPACTLLRGYHSFDKKTTNSYIVIVRTPLLIQLYKQDLLF